MFFKDELNNCNFNPDPHCGWYSYRNITNTSDPSVVVYSICCQRRDGEIIYMKQNVVFKEWYSSTCE
jgi:hypothetical protein